MNGVDIIVPIYNCERTIQKCIESVLKQSYKEYSLILIDDGSKDESGRICEEYAKKYPSIIYFKQDNQGVSIARNNGLRLGKRKYVIFLDADDYLPNDSLNNYFSNIKETDDWIIGSYNAFRSYKKISWRKLVEDKTYTQYEAFSVFETISKMLSTPWAKLYKRDVIEKNNILFDSNMSIGEDNRFNLMYLSSLNGNIKTINKIVYCYKLGGVASAIKYHENINDEYLKLAKTYDSLEELIGNSLNTIKFGLLSGTVKHYIVCLPRNKAINELENTHEIWKSYVFNSTDKWYLRFRDGRINSAYQSYVFHNFGEIVKKKSIRAIRLWCKNKI